MRLPRDAAALLGELRHPLCEGLAVVLAARCRGGARVLSRPAYANRTSGDADRRAVVDDRAKRLADRNIRALTGLNLTTLDRVTHFLAATAATG